MTSNLSVSLKSFFDSSHYFDAKTMRFFFLMTTVPGMLFLRASCFTRRLCFATPFEGRLALVLISVVLNCITPLVLLMLLVSQSTQSFQIYSLAF